MNDINRYFILGAIILSATVSGCDKKTSEEKLEAVITGGSMAPTLLGEHFEIECADCEFSFQVDSTKIPRHKTATCPNCGFTENSYSGLASRPPTPIELSTSPIPPSRWDIVAFRFNDSQQFGVKRIVGMPNESIKIVDGEVYANGQPVSKTWPITKEMRILVYDSRFRSPDVSLLQPNGIDTGLNEPNWLSPKKSATDNLTIGKVDFAPIHCFRGPLNRQATTEIQDNYGYNQTNSRTHLNDVNDLTVETNVKLGNDTQFEIHLAPSNTPTLKFTWDLLNNSVTIECGEDSTMRAVPISSEPHVFSASCVDQMLRAEIDGSVVCELEIQSTTETAKREELPIVSFHGRASVDSALELRRIRIFRDVFYTNRGRTEFQLGPDEYLVFGDNSPVSVDSRTWSKPAINREQVVGTVNPAKK